jgi:hypothetical protein
VYVLSPATRAALLVMVIHKHESIAIIQHPPMLILISEQIWENK